MRIFQRKSNGEDNEKFDIAAQKGPVGKQGEFSTLLVVAIELIERGASGVDLHHWGLRLRSKEGVYSVGPIPAMAAIEHMKMLNDDLQELKLERAPATGEEATSDDTPEAGPASENA